MAYLQPAPASNDNWTAPSEYGHAPETWGQRRYGVLPPRRRRRGGTLFLGLIAMPAGVWGLWLLLGAAPAPESQPLVFSVDHSAVAAAPDPSRGLKIVLIEAAPPKLQPETWGALPSAVASPVVATPLADAAPAAYEGATCREASTLAAQMTCIDPTLGEADQRMAAAYEAVLAAGVSPAALGRSQARWLATRDEAARNSPENLLAAYQAREQALRTYAAALERRAMTADADQPLAFTGAAPST